MRKQLGDAIPIDDPTPLQAVDAPDVVLTGTFIARRDVQSFYAMFKKKLAPSVTSSPSFANRADERWPLARATAVGP